MFGEVWDPAGTPLEDFVSIRFRWRVFGERVGGRMYFGGKSFNPLSLESVWRADDAGNPCILLKGFNPLSLESVWRVYKGDCDS